MRKPLGSKSKKRDRSRFGEAGTWLLAFLMALGLWVFVNAGERSSTRTLKVRLDLLDLPGRMVVTNRVPDHVDLQVAGSGFILATIDDSRLVTMVDLANVRPGRATYTLGPSDFSLPRNVEITQVSPSRVAVEVDRLSQRRFVGVPVVLRNARQAWQIVPPEVTLRLRGPKGDLGKLELPAGAVWVDATELLGERTLEVRPEVVVPPGFEVLEVLPKKIRLVPGDTAHEEGD